MVDHLDLYLFSATLENMSDGMPPPIILLSWWALIEALQSKSASDIIILAPDEFCTNICFILNTSYYIDDF